MFLESYVIKILGDLPAGVDPFEISFWFGFNKFISGFWLNFFSPVFFFHVSAVFVSLHFDAFCFSCNIITAQPQSNNDYTMTNTN